MKWICLTEDWTQPKREQMKIDWKMLFRTYPRDESMWNIEGKVKEMNDIMKRSNMYLIGIPKRRVRQKQYLRRYFPELIKDMNLQLQEVQWIPSRIHKKIYTPRLTSVKLLQTKDKEKILKVVRQKTRLFQGTFN